MPDREMRRKLGKLEYNVKDLDFRQSSWTQGKERFTRQKNECHEVFLVRSWC